MASSTKKIIGVIFLLTVGKHGYCQPADLCFYLNNNVWQENVDKVPFSNSSIRNNQLFLLGEFHGVKYSYDYHIALLKSLKERTDIRYYIAELDNCSAYFINKYLKDGDTAMLLNHFERYKGTFFYSKEYANCFIELRKLNSQYPADKQIQVLGVDILHQPVIAFDYIKEVFGKMYLQQTTTFPFIEAVLTTHDTAWKNVKMEDFVASALNELQVNSAAYRRIFSDKVEDLEFVLRNISNRNFANAHRPQFNQLRDSMMFENFKYLYKANNIGTKKMFGFFGRDHVFQATSSQTNWFGSLVKNKMRLSGILSVALFYTNCNQMIPSSQARTRGIKMKELYFFGKWTNDDGSFNYTKGIETLKKCPANKAGITVFNLAAFNSPYSNLKELITDMAADKSTTSYFQYAVLLRDSPAATPINNPEIKE